jgi:adenylyltransferase/sulfurtransferase
MSVALLRPDQAERYRRHLTLKEIGPDGQHKLLAARIVLIGVGGLGCPVAQYLAAAGVGRLGLVDPDRVDASNLQRQVLYGLGDLGRPKVEVARERIECMNPDVQVELFDEKLTSLNALDLIRDWDILIDGSDNFPARYLTNDACVLLGKPNVHGSVYRFEGQATVFDARRGPCYRCLFPEPPPPGQVPSCAEAGVLGVLPGMIAMIQATEAIKLVTGVGDPLFGRLLQYDALEMSFTEYRLGKDPECPVCGTNPSVTKLIDYEGFCGVGAGLPPPIAELGASEVQALRLGEERFLLLDVREPEEAAVARIEGALLIPLGELERRLGELTAWRERRIVVHCHHGGRSARACALLQEKGFPQVSNLRGGIDEWSLTVDPTVPRY